MYQLWVENEYGQRGIVASNEDYSELVKRAKAEVNEENMGNPLTEDEKKKNFTSYFAEICEQNGQIVENAFYAGKKAQSHIGCLIKKGSFEEFNLDDKDISLRFYIGSIRRDKTGMDIDDYWAMTPKGELITKISDQNLVGKTFYFIRKMRG